MKTGRKPDAQTRNNIYKSQVKAIFNMRPTGRCAVGYIVKYTNIQIYKYTNLRTKSFSQLSNNDGNMKPAKMSEGKPTNLMNCKGTVQKLHHKTKLNT